MSSHYERQFMVSRASMESTMTEEPFGGVLEGFMTRLEPEEEAKDSARIFCTPDSPVLGYAHGRDVQESELEGEGTAVDDCDPLPPPITSTNDPLALSVFSVALDDAEQYSSHAATTPNVRDGACKQRDDGSTPSFPSAITHQQPLLAMATDADLSSALSAFARPKRSASHIELSTITMATNDIDPSLFPDPYPSQPWSSPLPALSSGSSNSARSSAYTSPGSTLRHSGDSGHVNVAVVLPEQTSSDEIGLGITADDAIQISYDPSITAPSRAPILSKAEPDTRWNSSSTLHPRSTQFVSRPPRASSFDTSWKEEDREDLAVSTDDETDDDDKFDIEGDSFDSASSFPPQHNCRTEAAVIAEEGRATIVNGERMAVHQVPLAPGVTHLLLSCSTTPNAIPAFLMTTLPNISSSLLALDLQANFLMSLPASITTLSVLEELNVSSNPLRALPTFLASLHRSLRVLIADSAQITGLPLEMASMKRLAVLSLRRNKLHSVPDCLAGMDALEEIRLEGNEFLGPWKSLVEPLVQASAALSMFEAAGASEQPTTASSTFSISEDEESPSALDEEHTIRASLVSLGSGSRPLPRSFTAPIEGVFSQQTPDNSRSLVRTRTIPARPTYQRPTTPKSRQAQTRSEYQESGDYENELTRPQVMRRMRSANELRLNQFNNYAEGNRSRTRVQTVSVASPPSAPPMTHRYPSDTRSESISLQSSAQSTETLSNRFGSLKLPGTSARDMHLAVAATRDAGDGQRDRSSMPGTPASLTDVRSGKQPADSPHTVAQDDKRDNKSKWGFFKKMSMRSLKGPDGHSAGSPMRHRERPSISHVMSTPSIPRVGEAPEVEVTSVSASQSRAASPLDFQPMGPTLSMLLSDDPSSKSPLGAPVSPIGQSPTSVANRRRSFLPIDMPSPQPPVINPRHGSSRSVQASGADRDSGDSAHSGSMTQEQLERKERERLARAKRVLITYLQDMLDLSATTSNFPLTLPGTPTPLAQSTSSPPASLQDQPSPDRASKMRRPTLSEVGGRVLSESSFSSASSTPLTASISAMSFRDAESGTSSSLFTSDSDGPHAGPSGEERRIKDDKTKRVMIIREIVETEKTYVKGLQELMDIYIRPAAMPNNVLGGSSKETIVPVSERKAVFSGLDGLYHFHNENFLPALESATAPLLQAKRPIPEIDLDGQLSSSVALAVADVFLSHAAFMKMYSSYINNFDSATQRLRAWTSKTTPSTSASGSLPVAPGNPGLGIAMAGVVGAPPPESAAGNALTTNQRKRVKAYLKRCRLHPKHSQLNLEGYLLLPVQRIPRYRLLLEDLVRNTLPKDTKEDALDRALSEISSLAVNMNEGKRDSESRRKLVQWQSRIRGKFPSPLVQPHRRLIMDGSLHLTRVVRRNSVPFQTLTPDGDTADVQVDCLTPEETPRDLVGILCNDLLVLCKDSTRGQNPTTLVDLWAVLRMQTLAQPASVVHGSTLRLVDNKAILYFDAPSTSDALTWSRAINLHIPASKT